MSEFGEGEVQINKDYQMHIDALLSNTAVTALRTASEVTRSTGRETGFSLGDLPDGEFLATDVMEGGNASMEDNTSTPDQGNRRLEQALDLEFSGFEELVNIHFHPDQNPTPSSADLGVLSSINDSEVLGKKSLIGIGIVDEAKNIKLLLVKIKTKKPPSTVLIEEVSEDLREVSYFRENDPAHNSRQTDLMVSVLNNSGYYGAEIIPLKKGDSTWSPEAVQKLRTFLT